MGNIVNQDEILGVKQIFKDVVGYEGHYKVSNLGIVLSLKRDSIKIMRQSLTGKGYKTGKGYLAVRLTFNGKSKLTKVHILVAEAFLNYKSDGTINLVVDHINNISTDNRLDNLRVITNRENLNKLHLNSSSKYTGVCWSKNRGKWIAYIDIKGKRLHLGYFKCELAASMAYRNKLKEI